MGLDLFVLSEVSGSIPGITDFASIEFADLGWNTLPEHPVRVEDGYMFAPDRPGAGLDPKLELLEELSCSQK